MLETATAPKMKPIKVRIAPIPVMIWPRETQLGIVTGVAEGLAMQLAIDFSYTNLVFPSA
jgi:hypothetical protein